MFGDRVRAHRRRLGITQEELADRSGVGLRTIRDIETGRIGRPRPTTVRLLADVFGLSGTDRDDFHEYALGGAEQPAATTRQTSAGTRRDGSPGPAQLPAAVAGFAGRTAEMAYLDGLLAEPGERPTAVVISALAGTAGAGKTALAVHWAHRVADRFPDGQLYVNLRGFGPTGSAATPEEALRGFLAAFGVPPDGIPADLDALAARYRSLLAGRRVLIVLDNARDADQVRPLLPGTPGCLVLVTSRDQLSGLVAVEGAGLLAVDLLPPAEARQLLANRLGPDRLAAEPEAVDDIIGSCARLPLALAIVAARAATHPYFSLRTLADELRKARGLDPFSADDTRADVRAVFSWSYLSLRPPAARLFRLLSQHPGADVTAPAAASLAGAPPAAVNPLLAELTRAHLVTQHAPGRFAMHDLLRAYATELNQTLDTGEERQAATHRIVDHYLHTAYAAVLVLEPHRDPIAVAAPRPGVVLADVTDHERAMAWFVAEHRVLLATVEHAAAAGLDTHTWQLAWALATFLDRQGHWHDLAATQLAGLAAARRCGDVTGQAYLHRSLGATYRRQGREDPARSHLDSAFALFGRLGDRAGQARVLLSRALLCAQQEQYREALECARRALRRYRAVGHAGGEADALGALGWYHALLGDRAETIDYCGQAIRRYQEIGDRKGEAGPWDSLGYIRHRSGDHAGAVECFERGAALYRDSGARHDEAGVLTSLGDAYRCLGDVTAAARVWRRALAILDELRHPDADQVRAKLKALSHPGRVGR